MNTKKADIPVPAGMLTLSMSPLGYRKPWFVKADDFRVTDDRKYMISIKAGRCWICGHTNRKGFSFVTGPASVAANVAIEPPCHPECAEYAVQVCPFILNPEAKRRSKGLTAAEIDDNHSEAGANPGVFFVTTVKKYKIQPTASGLVLTYDEGDIIARRKWVEGQVVHDSASESDTLKS